MTREILTPVQLDTKPNTRHLAVMMISGAQQDERAADCVHNFLEVAREIHSPEADEFLNLYQIGRVEVYVPKVQDDSEFDRPTVTENVIDAIGVTHTEVLVNPIVWSDSKLIQKEASEAVRGVMVNSCRRALEKAVLSVNSTVK